MDLEGKVTFSEGVDINEALPRLEKLLGDGWVLDNNGSGIHKRFHFKTYTKVKDFVDYLVPKIKAINHHPTMILKYGSAEIFWTTHVPPGLSMKDVEMAEYCESSPVASVDASQAANCSGPSKA